MPYVVCEEDNRERKSSNQDLNEDTSINRKVSLRYNIHVVIKGVRVPLYIVHACTCKCRQKSGRGKKAELP